MLSAFIALFVIVVDPLGCSVLRNRSKQYQREETVFGVDVEMKEMEKDDNHFMRKTPEGLDGMCVDVAVLLVPCVWDCIA